MSDKKGETMLWRGRPIEDLTREELIEALRTQARLYSDQLASSIHAWETIGLVRHTRGRA